MAKQEDATIIDLESFSQAVVDFHNGLSRSSIRAVDLATVSGTLLDLRSGGTLLRQLGLKGSYYTKVTKGTTYVIFRGYSGLREVLQGTRYLASNAHVIRFGIGPNAIRRAAKFNGAIMIISYIALDITEFILSDTMVLEELFANIVVDVAIGAAAIGAAALVGIAAASVTTIAIPVAGAVLGAIVIGMTVSAGLSYLSDTFGLKEKLASAIEWTGEGLKRGLVKIREVITNAQLLIRQKVEQVERSVNRRIYNFERKLIWRFTPHIYPYLHRH